MPALPDKRPSAASTFKAVEFMDAGCETCVKLARVQGTRERQEEAQREGKMWSTSEASRALNLESVRHLWAGHLGGW